MLFVEDGDGAVFDDDVVAREADDALNEDFAGVFGVVEDNNFATGWQVEVVAAERATDQGLGVANLGDNQVVAVVQGVDHAGAEYVVGLKDKVVQYEHHRDREDDPGKNSGQHTAEAAGNAGESG